MFQTLMSIEAVARYLSCGEKPARKWLEKHRVPIAVDLGRGRGLGPRWRFSEIELAITNSAKKKSKKPAKPRKDRLDIFDMPVADQLSHYLGLTNPQALH